MGIHINNVEEGVRAPSSAFLTRACHAWLDCMKAYRNRVPEDWWPFWYGERPLVGFLAASIWQSGGACIEEFSAYKTSKRRRTYPGRGDLYFRHRGRKGDVREGNIEFKVHDIGISGTSRFENSLATKWRQAVADAARGQDDLPKFGGMFLRPYIGKGRKDQDIDRYDENLSQLLKTAWGTLEPDALAWWCPTQTVVKSDRDDTKNLLVGVILLLKRVKKARKRS